MLVTLGGIFVTLLALLFILVCVVMLLVILIQKPRGGGLSGAFGGAGGAAQTAFGARVGDVLTWFTVGCFVAFLAIAMLLTWTTRPAQDKEEEQAQGATPAAQPAPLPAAAVPGVPPATMPADTQPQG